MKETVYLEVVSGTLSGQRFTLDRPATTLGRQSDCDIIVTVDDVSRRHARILRENSAFILEDLNSLNGTSVNGERVLRRRLQDLDQIGIGDFVMVFHCDPSATVPGNASVPSLETRSKRSDDQPNRATVLSTINMNTVDRRRIDVNPAAKLRAVLDMIQTLGGPLNQEELLAAILDRTLRIFARADQVGILLTEGSDSELKIRSVQHRQQDPKNPPTMLPISLSVARGVVERGEAVLSTKGFEQDDRDANTVLFDNICRSTMCAPLMGIARTCVGAIQLDARERRPVFNESDLDILVSISSLVGQAIARNGAEEQFRKLLESAPDAMVIVDHRGVILLANEQTERIFGWTKQELIGCGVEMLMPERYRDQHVLHRQLYLTNPTVRAMGSGLELFGLHKDGTEIPVEISLSPLETETGMLVSAAVRDVSERRRMESELARHQQRLLQSERLAAIGETIAGLSHESRNALQRSQACLSLLKYRIEDAQSLELVAQIQQAQDHLHRLYEQVRQFAAPIQLDMERLRLDEILQEAWDCLDVPRQNRSAVLRQTTDGLNLRCEVDRFAIVQVFRNILENSLAAGDQPLELEAHWSPTNVAGRPAVRVAVRDNGPGLNEEQRNRLFEPFYTTKTKGTGLGMAIAKRLVEAHNGVIVAAAKQSGAEIIVTLPRIREHQS